MSISVLVSGAEFWDLTHASRPSWIESLWERACNIILPRGTYSVKKKKKKLYELGMETHATLTLQEMDAGEWLVWDQPGLHIEIFVSFLKNWKMCNTIFRSDLRNNREFAVGCTFMFPSVNHVSGNPHHLFAFLPDTWQELKLSFKEACFGTSETVQQLKCLLFR